MNIFGVGLPEMGLIMIVALLVFGPKKLPEIGRSLGKALKGLQDASKEFETEFKKGAESLEKTVVEPMKATLEEPRALTPDKAVSSGAASDDHAEVAEVESLDTSVDTSADTSIDTPDRQSSQSSPSQVG